MFFELIFNSQTTEAVGLLRIGEAVTLLQFVQE